MSYTLQFYDVLRYWPTFAEGLVMTCVFTLGAIALSLVIGTLAALGRLSNVRLLRAVATIYVEFVRNTPALILLFILYFGLPNMGLRPSSAVAAVVGLGLYSGSYVAEIVRSGIQAVHPNQIQAGQSLGMTRAQIFTWIVSIPAFSYVYPALCGQFILLMLGTSIVSAIGAEELTAAASRISSVTFRTMEAYVVIIAVYLVLSVALRAGLKALGRRVFRFRAFVSDMRGTV
jgi:polar amino acid transport system permease protein